MTAENTLSMADKTNERFKRQIMTRLPESERVETAIEGLFIGRRNLPVQSESCFYKPAIGLVIQGHKNSVIGSEHYEYGEGQYMVSGVDMPSITSIVGISPEKPFLSVSIMLDRYLITQLAAEVPPDPQLDVGSHHQGVGIATTTPDLLDSFMRLVGLLDDPRRIPILAPMIVREIHYHLLIGPLGGCLRSISTLGTQSNQVAQAISWLRDNFKEPLVIEKLASQVNMSESSFHRHFRKVTSLSPLQYQKRLRLYEAQRLMLAANMDAAAVAFEVGYESPTQFNREYKREFGEPPYRDVSRMRAAGIGPMAM